MHKAEGAPRSYGLDRQIEIYMGGLMGQKTAVPVPIAALEEKAQAVLTPEAYDYVAGGAGGEETMRANRRAFERWRIVPRMLRNVSTRDLSVELAGMRLPALVLLGPVGVQSIVHQEAELATARAASSLGLPFVLSTAGSRTIEQVAAEMKNSPALYQLYWSNDPDLTASMVERAERAGSRALIVTLDTPLLAWRERDLRHPYLPFLKGEGLANYFADPVFRSKLAEAPEKDPAGAVRHWMKVYSNTSLTWDDLSFLRRHTRLPILLKGILHPDDARKAVARAWLHCRRLSR